MTPWPKIVSGALLSLFFCVGCASGSGGMIYRPPVTPLPSLSSATSYEAWLTDLASAARDNCITLKTLRGEPILPDCDVLR